MPSWPPIGRDDLKEAAQRGNFDMIFPLLVRRLIAETANGLTEIDMPGGSGVSAGGFDGVVTTTGQTPEVPAGTSVWELSVTDDAGRKADKDYDKRTSGPDGRSTREITYVQGILSTWTKAREWASKRTAEGRWKAVKAYNLDSVDTWLDRAPATTAWLADQLGKRLPGVRAADDWLLRTWLTSTRISLGPEIILAGRESSAAATISALSRGQTTVTVAGDLTADEFRVVVAAAISRADHPVREILEARTLLVDDPNSLSQLISQRESLILVLTDPRLAAALPSGHGHQLIVRTPDSSRADVVVEPINSQAVAELLRSAGENWQNAAHLGGLARRSLSALRRSLAYSPETLRPTWSDNADALRRRLILLGRWEGTNSADRDVVRNVIGRNYTDIEDAALALASADDVPMLGRQGELWHLLAAEDAWDLISSQLTWDDLDAVLAASKTVLTEADRFFGMDQTEQLMAQMEGTQQLYSKSLRKGLATTLALLGSTESTLPSASSVTGQDLARRNVQDILSIANADSSYATWSGLRDVLRLLAEAAPEEFLGALRDGLQGPEPVHARMFTDSATDSSLFGSQATHSEFLWALETLAWIPEFFDEAVDLLANLAEIDPGGRNSNRPFRSISGILSCWNPMTSVDTEARFAALRRIQRNRPDLGRRVLLDLIPSNGDSQSVHPAPRYRAKAREVTANPTQVEENSARVVEMLIEDLEAVPERFAAIIKKVEHLPAELRARFIVKLTDLGGSLTDDLARASLYDALLSIINRHREYSDTWWALSPDALTLLDSAATALAPRSLQLRFKWLFETAWIALGDVSRRDDFDAYDQAALQRRADAVGTILAEDGLDGLVSLAEIAGFPHLVGIGLGAHTNSYDDQMLIWLGLDQVRREISHSYLSRRLRDEGTDFLGTYLEATEDASVKAALLQASDDRKAVWNLLPDLGQEVEREYWIRFVPYGLGHDFDGVLQAMCGLVAVERNAMALQLLSIYSERIDDAAIAEVAAAACEGLLTSEEPDSELHHLSDYDFGRVFNLLSRHRETIGMQRIVAIEWQLFPGLGFDPDSPALHDALATEPRFFAELVSYIYRPDDEGDDEVGEEPTESQIQMARRAADVLRSWHRCPGSESDGTVDPVALQEWVDAARAFSAERGVANPADSEIGRVAAHAGPDTDGNAPPLAVQDLVERMQSDRIDEGLRAEIYNKKGATTRGLYDGGDQERGRAASFRDAASKSAERPRMRRIFRRLADIYERDALRLEVDAERRRRGLDN